jgi:hypothetical protein
MPGKDLQTVTVWEYLFILVAVAFTLDEYTASKEHGWISELFRPASIMLKANLYGSLFCERACLTQI